MTHKRQTKSEEAPDPKSESISNPVNQLEAAQDELMQRAEAEDLDGEEFALAMDQLERNTPVSQGEIDDENRLLVRRRDCFRRFAGLFAGVAAQLDFVERIVLFGSVAAPLRKEIPRFARLRRARVVVWHECKDVDVAIWLSDFTRLRELKRAVNRTVNQWQQIAVKEHLPGIPHHQLDVFLMEPVTNRYRGNLCRFSQCPKGKRECEVAGCGAQPFLQLYEDFSFDPHALLSPHAVVLFDRNTTA